MLRVALCQTNLPVGDIDGNAARIRAQLTTAQAAGADLILFPELSICGYPPEDLLLRPSFAEQARRAVHAIAADVRDTIVVAGVPHLAGDLYNAAAVLAEGSVQGVYRKCFLPNYSVFDEQRYFARGDRGLVIDINGTRVGVTICEDLWYPGGPAQWAAVDAGAELIVTLSASPYHRGKGAERERMLATRAVDYAAFLAFCNAVGGQDELVFDGHSVIVDPTGRLVARARQFEEDMVVADLDLVAAARRRLHDPRWRQQQRTVVGDRVDCVAVPRPARRQAPAALPTVAPLLDPEAEVYRALVLGTSDYVRKSGFTHAVIGVSGGIDSALALVVAVDALGADAITAVSMSSPYTASMNEEDTRLLTERLGVRQLDIPIHELMAAYSTALRDAFANTEPGIAEENLQARIRGNLVMALSNKFGWLVLTTGNKSEMSVGYATLYGDMAGGFAVLKDVLKTWVYRIARWRNRDGEVIPQRILDKPPSAELRPDQRDTDSLPPYETLDAVLEAYVEQDRMPRDIEASGHDAAVVARVVGLVDRAEYKRRQAPPGVRISARGFGKDRRLPIATEYRAE